jgi:hypothetical protein
LNINRPPNPPFNHQIHLSKFSIYLTMLTDLLLYINDQMRVRNPYFKGSVPIAVRYGDKLVKYSTKNDFEDCGFDDRVGCGFYNRIEPVFNYKDARRQLTSSRRYKEVSIDFSFVAFCFDNPRFNSLVTVEKLASDLQGITWMDWSGTERNILVNVTQSMVHEQTAYQSEMGKPFDGHPDFSACLIRGKIVYVTSTYRCLKDCDVFKPFIC